MFALRAHFKHCAGTAVLASALIIAAGPNTVFATTETVQPSAPTEGTSETRSLLGAYLAGRVARTDHDTSSAAEFYGHALAKDPESDVIIGHAFLLEALTGNWQRAVALAEQLAKNERSDKILARYTLGVDKFIKGEYEEADRHFSAAKKGQLAELTTQLAQAWIKVAQQKNDDAIKLLDGVKDANWSRSYLRYHKGLIADLAGRNEVANEAFSSGFKKNPRNLRMSDAYARHAANKGDVKQAKEILRQHLGEVSNHPIPKALLEEIETGKKPGLLVKTPREGLAEVFYVIGEALVGEGVVETGVIYLQAALHLRGDLELARVLVGEVYESNKKHEQAIAAFDLIPEGSPVRLNVQVRKAFSLNSLEKTDEATSLLEELAKDYPKDTRPLDALGNILRAKEKFSEAVVAYTRALERVKKPEKSHWALYYARGVAYERMKDWPKAEGDLKAALKLHPDQPQVLNYLGYSWVDQGKNLKEGMKLIRKAVKLKPNDGFFVDSLGWAHYRLGEYPQAAEHLEKAVELQPADPVINDHLGDALWRVGRELEARYQWSLALTLNPEPDDAEKIKKKLADGLEPAGRKEPAAQKQPQRKHQNAQVRNRKSEN